MDSRTILAFSLMILIYIFFFQPAHPPPKPAVVVSNSVGLSNEQQALKPSTTAEPHLQGLKLKTFKFQNEKVQIELDATGAIQKVKFPLFRKSLDGAAHEELSFGSLKFNELNLMTSQGAPRWQIRSEETNRVLLDGQTGKLKFTREIWLANGEYGIRIIDTLKNEEAQSVKAEAEVLLRWPVPENQKPVGFFEKYFIPHTEIFEFLQWADGDVYRDLVQNIKGAVKKEGLIQWSGFADKYFFYGFAPQNISIQKSLVQTTGTSSFVQELRLSDKTLAPGEETQYSHFFYLGPKEIPELRKALPELGEVVDYGSWIGPISRLLLSLLHFFYKLIPNFGVGIILLTILVKLALFPLSYKSAVSMRKLQVVQPKMKEIRDKYKEDRQRMNAEMMALYRAEKVNPIGGCLPILIQMPVFFALYRVFFASIELRQAPFFGWIQDLSTYDPYFVTPVLMTALMWYQTKLTPQPPAMEENEAVRVQRAMMKWMPIIFGALMIFLPAGLTLYFLVNALLSLIQQIYLNKRLEKDFPLAAQAKTA